MSRCVLLADDGYGCHIESSFEYISLCGRRFDLPPFEQGTHRGFITGDEPSARARQVTVEEELED